MSIPKITHYIEVVVMWSAIAVVVAAFKWLPSTAAWITTGCLVVAYLLICVVLSKIDDWHFGKIKAANDRATKVEDQIDEYLNKWVRDETMTRTDEGFEEAKNAMMKDWMDTHPTSTRMDFINHWEKSLDSIVDDFVYEYKEPHEYGN
jgi:hypothetical protein